MCEILLSVASAIFILGHRHIPYMIYVCRECGILMFVSSANEDIEPSIDSFERNILNVNVSVNIEKCRILRQMNLSN